MKLYYYCDTAAWESANAAGRDYTPAYLPVMLKNSGLTGAALIPEALETLTEGDVLLIGAESLTAERAAALGAAIDRGCYVIAFATEAPGLFPEITIDFKGKDAYDVIGYFRFSGSEEPLPVLEACGTVTAGETRGVLTADGAERAVYAQLGDRVWLWGFDLPATLWRAADGRPTTDTNNPVGFARIPDGYVVGEGHDFTVAYADSYMRHIETLLQKAGFARFYALPEKNGAVCDLALYFGGDDDATSGEIDRKAAANMRERGLPYHLNMMPMDAEGHFQLSREEAEELRAGGCEFAVHYNFTAFPFTEEGHRVQSDMFERHFGFKSVCPVNHCLVQVGSAAERYRMEAECGCLGDNSRFQIAPDPTDINAFNLTGFATGSAFPRFVLCDAAHGNRALPFCDIYMSFYEPRLHTEDPAEAKKLEDYLEAGNAYGRTLQLFTHPHYISDVWGDPVAALRALNHAVDYVKAKGWNVWYCGPDELMYWWHDRAACTVTDVTEHGFTVNNPTAHTVLAVLPETAKTVTLDGKVATVVTKVLAGKEERLLAVPGGCYTVQY